MNSFDYLGFDRSKIGKLLGINLYDNIDDYNLSLKKSVPSWLVPYISRDSLLLTEVAAFICGREPSLNSRIDSHRLYESYIKSLWDAVDNNKLKAKDIVFYDNPEDGRANCTLMRSDVEKWIKLHEFNWPLPFSDTAPSKPSTQIQNNVVQWGEFAGKNTALMFIAGMSIALEQAGGKFVRGGRLNKLEVARTAINAINQYGDGTEITPKALTDLLNEALSEKAAKLEVQKKTD